MNASSSGTDQRSRIQVSATKLAADFPKKDVTVIFPWSAGGGTDTILRGLAKQSAKVSGLGLTYLVAEDWDKDLAAASENVATATKAGTRQRILDSRAGTCRRLPRLPPLPPMKLADSIAALLVLDMLSLVTSLLRQHRVLALRAGQEAIPGVGLAIVLPIHQGPP